MKLTNAYQAILAKLGGNQAVNIPAPRNKYEKLLNDIPVNGGGGGSSEVVIADTQTVAGVAPSDPSIDGAEYVLTTTESYGDPASYSGKYVVAEITRGGESVKRIGWFGVVLQTEEGPFLYTSLGKSIPELASEGTYYLEMDNTSVRVQCSDAEPGEEVTIKLSVMQPDILLIGYTFLGGSTLRSLCATWQEIHDAMLIRGIPVAVNLDDRVVYATEIHYSDGAEYPYQVTFGDASFETDDPDGYPQEMDYGV